MKLKHWIASLITPFAIVSMASNSNAVAAETYANTHLLTSTAKLADLLKQPNVRVVDVRSRDAYLSGHIPGAVHLGADDVIDRNSHVDGDLLPPGTLAAMLGKRGIDKGTRVILYDDRGGFHASRLFWMLEYFGHGKASLLNGGYPRWKKEGRTVSTDIPRLKSAAFALTPMPRKVAAADWLLDRKDDPTLVVIDVRPPKVFKAGHIPGARNIPWKQNLAADATLKSAAALLKHFAARGVTKDKNVAVHCQNGKAAAHSYFTLRLLGYPRIRSYDRSWAEWGAADDLPKIVEKRG